jgi:hypothetical protein
MLGNVVTTILMYPDHWGGFLDTNQLYQPAEAWPKHTIMARIERIAELMISSVVSKNVELS